jgi:hypothetical protein
MNELEHGPVGLNEVAAPVLRVAALVQLAVQQESEMAKATAALAAAKESLRRTLMEDLPELMQELTLTDIKLLDGTSVEIKPEIDCGISEDNRFKAHQWLRERGFGALIKTEVTAKFGREQTEQAEKAVELLTEAFEADGIVPEVKEAVHPATLKSFVKERMAAAAEEPDNVPPIDLFSIFSYSKAKVIPPKLPKPPKIKKGSGATP